MYMEVLERKKKKRWTYVGPAIHTKFWNICKISKIKDQCQHSSKSMNKKSLATPFPNWEKK
jgi:hypothetical protein